MKKIKIIIVSLAFVVNGFTAQSAQAQDLRAEPEAATRHQVKNVYQAKHHLVVAANPYASRAGRDILRLGGSAIDAAIAVQMVLNLVEPQSSGIGGGGFLLHWDQQAGRLTSFDGRETAPLAARPTRFMKNDIPMKFKTAVTSGLSVGTPGLLKMLEKVHKQQGHLPWKQLFQPALHLATQGFIISPRLNALLKKENPKRFGAKARAYFYDDSGVPKPVGTRLVNLPFAKTLERIADKGAPYFYRGELAELIAKNVQNPDQNFGQNFGQNKGDLTSADLRNYRAIERPAICVFYRGYKVCGMGPPSSGMLTLGQILKLIEPFDLGKTPLNTRALHLITEASKLAYADRKRYMADHDFIQMPQGLLAPRYLSKRARLIKPEQSMGKAKPGNPPTHKNRYGTDASRENNGTSHISIIDGNGNAVSMTSSIEGAFGAHLMVSGFLLNNELTDFSFRPKDKQGRPIANRVQPLKRPRSSMAPTMVFDRQGRLVMVVGSPGGSRIILYVLKTIVGRIDWGLDANALVQLPNFGSRNGPLELEKGPGANQIATSLQALGHKIRLSPMTSGIHLILRENNSYVGAADPRREGVALGD